MLIVKNIKKYLNKYYNAIIIAFLLIFIVYIIIYYYIKNKENMESMENTDDKIIVGKYCIGFFAVCSHIFRDISTFFNEKKN